MLRLLVLLVVLANVVFFGWARSWFAPAWPAPRHGEREPERLAAQLHPEAVTVLPPSAASAAVTAARVAAAVCLEAGPLADAEFAAAETALGSAGLPGGSWARETVPPPPSWLLILGRLADPAVRRAREAELQKRSLAFEPLAAPAEWAPGLLLSRHGTEAEAQAALAALSAPAASQPLKGARVVSLPAPPAQSWLRVPQADAAMQTRLQALPAAALAGGFKACAKRP